MYHTHHLAHRLISGKKDVPFFVSIPVLFVQVVLIDVHVSINHLNI